MASSEKRRASTSPSATALASTTTTTTSASSSTNPTSSSPYFLPLVASRLTNLQDFFALRAACRTYRDLIPPSPANLASQAPLLLFPRMASASGALFHVPLRRILRFRLPCTRLGRPTKFHSFGCRVSTQDRAGYDTCRELRIRHLLTGERARLPDLPRPRDSEEVVFSGDLVVTFRKCCCVLYYCHIGDDHWQAVYCDVGHLPYDLMFVKGTLYALIYNYSHYRLAVVKLGKNSAVLSFLGDKLSVPEVNCPRFWLAGVIIRQFEGTACTSLGALGSGASILWLMGLIMNSLSTTQGELRIMDLRFGSFQAFADAVSTSSQGTFAP
uniref:KIB1-4 beta-propeller domain-containing protein n=1 Tax=Aegilops tauschii TaxID=37682 RepID=N1R234_AEGTA